MAGTVRNFSFLYDPLHKRVPDCPSRHSHRAFYNDNILFFRFYISFLISDIRITFFCGYEACRHLYGVCSQLKCPFYLLFSLYSACKGYRDFPALFFIKFSHRFQYIPDFLFIGIFAKMLQLIFGKSKVPPCKRPFYYQKIRNPLIFSVPVP